MSSKFKYRPNGAYKLLVHVIYGQYSFIETMPRSIILLRSIRKLSRTLGTQSVKVNKYLQWLEEQGYIESLQYDANRRSCKFRVRTPSNVVYQ